MIGRCCDAISSTAQRNPTTVRPSKKNVLSLAPWIPPPADTTVTAAPQVRQIQASGLLLLGWAARGKGEREGASGWDSLPGDLVKQCLDVVATAEKLHSMDVAIKSHAGWARDFLRRLERQKGGGAGAIVEHRAPSNEEEAWAGASSLEQDEEGGPNELAAL